MRDGVGSSWVGHRAWEIDEMVESPSSGQTRARWKVGNTEERKIKVVRRRGRAHFCIESFISMAKLNRWDRSGGCDSMFLLGFVDAACGW